MDMCLGLELSQYQIFHFMIIVLRKKEKRHSFHIECE